MFKQFKYGYEEDRFRADRALTWCAFEGSEIGDVMFDLYRVWDLHGVGPDEDVQTMLGLMERWALDHAREIHSGTFTWEPERTNVMIALRHLRETGELHPDIARMT